MKKYLSAVVSVVACLFSATALAATGETWQVTTQTDMPGAPFAMPASTMTVCMEKGKENDPKRLMQQDSDCQMSDIKTSGNKTTWKMRCDKDGEKMSGSGEVTHQANRYQGITKLSGQSAGETVDMTMNYSGKRAGVACDPSVPPVVAMPGMENMNDMMGMAKTQMASEMAEQCEVARYDAKELISNRFFGADAMCASKQKFACKVISKDVPKKTGVYVALAKHDDTSEVSIAELCKIDMAAATKSICKKVDSSNYGELEEYCQNEAKTFADAGRSYTSTSRSSSVITDNPVGDVIDGARKLKGMFGF
ncbi:MAG: DUF3617 family protein [Sideroxyarcus sp.]|nr:DUF3617 family protein [Sideroxyarcus sp.]